jgi:methionine--tRNA ligase beta chain
MTIDDFMKVDLRIGRIVAVDRIEGSEKLLKFSVDIGETALRQILSGVAKVYVLENLIGKSVIVAANLDPRIIVGVESQGMLLGIENGVDGAPMLIFIENQIIPGSKVS